MLEKIQNPNDVKKLNIEELHVLADDVREALFHRLSKHGGHFGPNFGMVEATIALHYVFDSPKDKFVFDVSHQSYVHKMLTGRTDGYLKEEKFDEISGYTDPNESEHDFFTIGHTSTSISLASGLAKGRDVNKKKENILAIIGDGSLSGGEALEGLDFASELNSNFIIVVNDNDMSIAENHGGLYKNLKELRDSNGTCANNLFKAMGLDYVYHEEGNDIAKLIETFQKVKDIDHPIVVHMHTQKGKGYPLAQAHKEDWHWSMPFDRKTGEPLLRSDDEDYGTLTADYLLAKMKQDASVVTLVAGVPTNIGFTKEKRDLAGSQFVDVGIAEEHAVAMISGIAKNHGKAIFATHSSFMQRTYDQLSQDLCINQNPATILVNTASIYGMNDVTHLGIFDIAFMSNIPNLVYLAPTSKEEYFAMLEWSIEQQDHPVAIRIPCNGVVSDARAIDKEYHLLNKYKIERQGTEVAILALGDFYQLGEEIVNKLKEELHIQATLINPRYITGMDESLLTSLQKNHKLVLTLEDGILDGGFGDKIARFYGTSSMKVKTYGFKKEFIDRYQLDEILFENGLTPQQVVEDVKKILK